MTAFGYFSLRMRLRASFAPTGELLILARFVQGIGGAMILPTTLSLINSTFRGRERGIAFAVWGSTIGGMAAVGPLLLMCVVSGRSARAGAALGMVMGSAFFLPLLVALVSFDQCDRAARRSQDLRIVARIGRTLPSAMRGHYVCETECLGGLHSAQHLAIG